MAFAIPFVWMADPASRARGINLIVHGLQRIARQLDPRVKNYHWLRHGDGAVPLPASSSARII